MEIFNNSVSALSLIGSFFLGFGVVVALVVAAEMVRQLVNSIRGGE